jgi:murein DD-endopeptidase MepM/ murein hydrolase activator NlpD
LTIAISNPEAHFDEHKYSIDYLMPFNVPILAASSGKVIDVKDDSNEGGIEEKYKNNKDNKYQNYITIKHSNGEYSQYVHLGHKSALVKVGDVVKEGEPIAKGVGMTGYTSAPHLHFMVFKDTENKLGFESLKIKWKGKSLPVFSGKVVQTELQKEKYKPLLNSISKSLKK